MSKTFTYVLLVIAVYVAIIASRVVTGKKDNEDKLDKSTDSSKEDKVSKGVEGQQKYRKKYRIGWVK